MEVAVPKKVTYEMKLSNQRLTDGMVDMLYHRSTERREQVEEDTLKRYKSNIMTSFSDDNLRGIQAPYDDFVVVSTIIANYDIRRILIDNGGSMEVLLYDAFVRMNLPKDKLQRTSTPLTGFRGNPVVVEGKIVLPMIIGMEPCQKTLTINFMVVRTNSAYNAILG